MSVGCFERGKFPTIGVFKRNLSGKEILGLAKAGSMTSHKILCLSTGCKSPAALNPLPGGKKKANDSLTLPF